jgi:hypothetical protein
MTIRIKYTHICDYCKVEFKVEEYEVLINSPAQSKQIPVPDYWGRGVGHWYACLNCVSLAMESLTKTMQEKQ